MPSSSWSSRRRHSSGVSFGSILPPGNSDVRAKRHPFFRLAMRTLPSLSITAAVTMSGFTDVSPSSPFPCPFTRAPFLLFYHLWFAFFLNLNLNLVLPALTQKFPQKNLSSLARICGPPSHYKQPLLTGRCRKPDS